MLKRLLALSIAVALAGLSPAAAAPRRAYGDLASDFADRGAPSPHRLKATLPTPAALANAINAVPWINGRGLVTGAQIEGVSTLTQQIFQTMGTWDGSGAYHVPSGAVPLPTGDVVCSAASTTLACLLQSYNGNPLESTLAPHVANNTALVAYAKYAQPVVRDGYLVPGDGGRATYVHSTSPCTLNSGAGDGGSQIPAAGCWNIDWSSVGGVAHPALFGGAVGVPVTQEGQLSQVNAQPAIQAAVNTGRSVHLGPFAYKLKTSVIVKTPGQHIYGDGPWVSRVEFNTDFNTANGAGLFVNSTSVFSGTGQEGPIYENFMEKGFQPEVNPAQTISQQLATLVQVSCIDARDTFSGKYLHLYLSTCMRGIDLRGNTGQSIVDDFQGSNFISDINIDGATDTIRLSKIHGFPLAVTSNQAALIAANANSILSGRVDDLKIADSMCIDAHVCLNFFSGAASTLTSNGYTSGGGQTTGTVTNYDFDIVPIGFNESAGQVSVTGGYSVATQAFAVSGGDLELSNTSFGISQNGSVSVSGGARVIISNSRIADFSTNYTGITQTGGVLVLTGNQYDWTASSSANVTGSKVYSSGGQLVATGNTVYPFGTSPKTSGTAFFQVVDASNSAYNLISANNTADWPNLFPINSAYGNYAGNGAGGFTMPSGLNVTGYDVGGTQGKGDGCHLTFVSSTGYFSCIYPNQAWRPLNMDASALVIGSQNPSMTFSVTPKAVFSGQTNAPLATPASSSAACTVGDREADASYIYICTATNTWKRVALGTF